MESQVSEERLKLERLLTKACDKNGSREETRTGITNRLDQICSHFLPHFVHADTLAQKYQGIYTLSSKLIYLLAAVIVTAVSAGAIFKVQETAITLFEIAAIVFILFLIYYGNRIGWRKRWQDNRLLAERLRHAVFLSMADQPACSDAPRNTFYCKPHSDDAANRAFSEIWNDWIRKPRQDVFPDDQLPVIRDFLLTAWIEDQRNWHQSKTRRHKRHHEKLSLAGEILFFTTLIAAVLHLVFHIFHVGGEFLAGCLTFLAIACPSFGGAFSAMRNHFEHNKLSRRSEQMARMLTGIMGRLMEAADMNSIRSIAEEAEILMMSEAIDWHALIGFNILRVE